MCTSRAASPLRARLAAPALVGRLQPRLVAVGTLPRRPDPAPPPASLPEAQLEMFATQDDHLRQALLDLDLDKTTPLDALQHLQRLQDDAR